MPDPRADEIYAQLFGTSPSNEVTSPTPDYRDGASMASLAGETARAAQQETDARVQARIAQEMCRVIAQKMKQQDDIFLKLAKRITIIENHLGLTNRGM